MLFLGLCFLLDSAQGLCMPEGNIPYRVMASDAGRPGVEGAVILQWHAAHCVIKATSETQPFLNLREDQSWRNRVCPTSRRGENGK